LKDKHQAQYEKRLATRDLVMETAKRINKNDLGLLGSFDGMIKLLNDFNFIKENTLTLKGRIAREVDVYVAQVIVEAVLDPLNPSELAALLSAFVCDFKPRVNYRD
jgi:superfamily II RNA helicase